MVNARSLHLNHPCVATVYQYNRLTVYDYIQSCIMHTLISDPDNMCLLPLCNTLVLVFVCLLPLAVEFSNPTPLAVYVKKVREPISSCRHLVVWFLILSYFSDRGYRYDFFFCRSIGWSGVFFTAWRACDQCHYSKTRCERSDSTTDCKKCEAKHKSVYIYSMFP